MSSLTPADDRAREWLERGSLYRWEPVSGKAAGKSIDIFHVEAGRPDAPLLLLVHGFPTSSIDWYDVIDRLAEDYRVCALDFPGYGFSGKPPDWPYSLEVDAGLLVHHLRNVLAASKCRVVAHDRGDSVALLMHHNLSRGEDPAGVTIEHLVLSNGNIFLPLANLTTFQKLILDPDRAKQVLEVMTPAMLAAGMGNTTFTPQRPPGDPTVEALAATLAHNDGISVLHDTVQYLRERAEHEVIWLQSLAASEVPSTVIWGICDTVSPPRVAMHVWEHYLQKKPGSNELWIVPAANHYLQNDRPDAFAEALLHSLERQGPSDPGPLEATPGAAVRVDHSAPALPDPTSGFVV
ncbi:MAG TPA: alpha/beta hydrolase [Acidimicrobiales bacterium]|nr:alpha/beta hydrolase [Acidimicrobiales bacterium]